MDLGQNLFYSVKGKRNHKSSANPALDRLREIAEPYSTLAYKIHKKERRDDRSPYSSHLEQVVMAIDYMLDLEQLSTEDERIIISSHWLHDGGEFYHKNGMDIRRLFSKIRNVDDEKRLKDYIVSSVFYNSNWDDNDIREFLDGMLHYPDEFQQFSLLAGKIADIWHNSGTSKDFSGPAKTVQRIDKNNTYIMFLPMARQALLAGPYNTIIDVDRLDYLITDAVEKREMSTEVYTGQLYDYNHMQKAVSF